MENKEEIYVNHLARCSMDELVALKEFVSSHQGQMRFASMMLRCITTALLLKVGLEPA